MKRFFAIMLCLCLTTVQAAASEIILTEETSVVEVTDYISDNPVFEIVIDDTPIEPALERESYVSMEPEFEEEIIPNTSSYTEEETEAVAEYYEEVSDGEIEVDYNALLHTGEFVVNDGYVNGGADYFTTIQFSYEDQEFLYNLCQEYNVDYAFFLATIYCESMFNPNARHKNSNGTVDRGICQINSGCGKIGFFKEQGWITCLDDLYDTKSCLQCGVYFMSIYTDMFGSVEQAYACYNTGKTTIKSNKNSRRVMRAYELFAPYFE